MELYLQNRIKLNLGAVVQDLWKKFSSALETFFLAMTAIGPWAVPFVHFPLTHPELGYHMLGIPVDSVDTMIY